MHARFARDEIINSLRENNIVIPIINSVTSVNLKKAGMAIRNSVTKKQQQYRLFWSALPYLWTSRVWFLIFGCLDLFSRDQTFITSRIFVDGFCSYFNSVVTDWMIYKVFSLYYLHRFPPLAAVSPATMTSLGRFRNLGPRCLGKFFLPKS